MKRLLIFGAAVALTLARCKDGSGDSAMNQFKQIPGSTFEGGATLPNGDYAKYKIQADDTNATAEVEIRRQGSCSMAMGKIPVATIGGTDANGQIYQLENMKVQIEPKDAGLLEYNRQFVHLIVDHGVKTECSRAPAGSIPAQEFAAQEQRHFFSKFGLSPKLLQMATPALIRGSSTYMLYFRSQDMGLAFDSATGQIVGIDVPKHKLFTDYEFTANRSLYHTVDIPEGELFPLMLTAGDLKTLMHTNAIVRELQGAVDLTINESPEDRQNLINSTWDDLVNK